MRATRIDHLEESVHGQMRGRNVDDEDNNGIQIGVQYEPMQLVKGTCEDAQWTGTVTSIAISMLESGKVDAVVCIASGGGDNQDGGWSEAEPF